MEMLKTLLAALTVFGLAFLLLNVRYFFTSKKYRGTCSSNSNAGKEEGGVCAMCGRRSDEACGMPEA